MREAIWNWFIVTCALVSCVLSGAALAVSLTHSGPAGARGPQGIQGPAGPQGSTGRAAQASRLGLCWQQSTSSSGGITWVQFVSIDQVILSNGVYTCPQGDTFVSIVPGSQP